MHKPSSLRDYLISGVLAACFFALILSYLVIRQGDVETFGLNAESRRLFNLAFAGSGALLLGFAFLVGPLARYFDIFDSWLQYRKEFGILGACLAFAHGSLSFFPQLARGGIDLWARGGALFWGTLGIALLLVLLIFSYPRAIRLLGGQKWWLLQRWGIRLVILFTAFHVLALRWSGWQRWIDKPDTLPPTGLLLALFLLWIVLIRLYEAVFVFRGLGWATRELPPVSPELVRGRRFFLGSLILLGLAIASLFVISQR